MSTRTRSGHDVWTLLGVGVVALAAAVLSFSSLQALAERAGYTSQLAALLPLAIDAQAVVATRAWLAAHTPARARRYARGLALAAVAGSVAGNAGEHAMAAAGAVTPWWVVVAIASVPPVALAATAHLAALLATTDQPAEPAQTEREASTVHTDERADKRSTRATGERSTRTDRERSTDAHSAEAVSAQHGTRTGEAVSAHSPRGTARTKPRGGRSPKGEERARAVFAQHAEAGTLDRLTGSQIAAAGGVSPATGRRWLKAWRAENDRPQLAVVGEHAQ